MRLCLLFMLTCWSFAMAQPPRHFRHFTEKDGLSDSRVQAIVRDGQGFLWVGTANGLNRYDGYNFKHYLPDPIHPERSVCNELIHDLKIDQKGQMWIATANGLNRYNPQNQTFRKWINEGRNDGSLPNPLIWNLAMDAQDRLWLSVDNKGLCRYDAATDKFIVYPWREFVRKTFPERLPDAYLKIYQIDQRSPTAFWLQTNIGVFSFDWKQERFAYHPMPKSFPIATSVTNCKEETYFGSWYQNLLRYDPCAGEWTQICIPAPNAPECTGQHVTNIWPYKGGKLILTQLGIYWLPNGGFQVQAIQGFEHEEEELPRGIVHKAFTDNDQGLWLGGESGLWLAEPQQLNFKYVPLRDQAIFDNANCYPRFLELPGRRLLTLNFYYHQLLLIRNGETEKSIDLPPKSALLHRDRSGKIWVGGGNQLFNFDLKNFELIPFPINAAGWIPPANGYFQDMAEDHEGNFWFAHFNNGALVWKPKTQTWWIPDSSQGFISKHVTSIVTDSAHATVYLGTEDYGLFVYDAKTNQFELFQHDPSNPESSLAAYTVFDLCLDPDGAVWAATDPGGVSRFDPKAPAGQQFLNIRAQNGLPGNRVTNLLFDQRGRLWVCTLGGLACLDKTTGRIRAFTKDDGLPKEFLDQALSLMEDGSILNSTVYGYFKFHPDSLLQENPQSEVHLTSFKIFDSEIGDSLLLGGLKQLDLSWKQNYFQFEFASRDILSAGKTEYAYRLQGFDANWRKNGHRHVASYTNVPPGDYVLEVKSGIEGRWNTPGMRLPIHIAPPFWVTWWFRIAVILGCCALIYSIYRFRIRQIRREEALKTDFNHRIARTEMAALRAQMNPHFVFNCLSSINRFIMVNQPEEASAYLTKFSRLIRLILDNSRTDTVVLSKELEALKLYIEMEQMRFADRFEYSLEIDPQLQVEHLEIPPLLIQPYVENAIWHGLMHKKEGCMLTIRLYPQGKRLCIEIEDNGVGRAKAMELKSRSATAQKSHGMKVTSERLEVINRLYGTEATVETTDLFDEKGLAAGTRILLQL